MEANVAESSLKKKEIPEAIRLKRSNAPAKITGDRACDELNNTPRYVGSTFDPRTLVTSNARGRAMA